MAGLGTYLSRSREERGLSIDDVARATRVAPRYLRALEDDDFAALPASVFTKGYIRAYCQALDLPVDEALERYARSDGTVAAAPAPVAVATARASDGDRRPRGTLLLSFLLLLGFGGALFAVTLLREAGRPEMGARRAESPPPPAATSPPPAAAPAPAPEGQAKVEPRTEPVAAPSPATPPEAAPPAVAATPQPGVPRAAVGPATSPPAAPRVADARPAAAEPRPPADVARTMPPAPETPVLQLSAVVSPYRLVARTMEATWLRVRTDDGRATEETIPAGEVREWISNRPFVLTIGNAAGVALELNGQKLPPLGGRGVVIGRLTLPPAEP
jgi:cytoskeleton protein RodZ